MKKIIRLTESDLVRIVKRVINESEDVNERSLAIEFVVSTERAERQEIIDKVKEMGLDFELFKEFVGKFKTRGTFKTPFKYDDSYIAEQSMGGWAQGLSAKQSGEVVKGWSEPLKKLTSITFDQFMEGLREFLTSGTGFVVQLILEVLPGIGQFINVGAWSLLTVYDVMLGVNKNKWDWFNIIVDLCAVVTTGPGGKYVKKALSPVVKFANQSIEVFASAISKNTPKVFKYVLKLVKTIKSFVPKIAEHIKKLISYFGKNLKNTAIYKGLIKLSNQLSTSVSSILTKIENAFVMQEGKLVSSLSKAKHTAQHTAQHAGTHYGAHQVGHALAAAVAGGHH